ncbi:MAG: nitric oxide synthase [Proteobacteria bacterium]|nr:nitric oxide synthase [Pseudomonadota bacterium]MBU1741638.1 nitric oxide synthase [Pseudomonadota bacterium]
MARFLIVYAGRGGQTKIIAQLLGEGIRIAGHEARLADVAEIKSQDDLTGYDGYAFGSATYHGDMIPGMKTMLFLAEKAGLEGKIGGSFGSYGWSGEAVTRIFDTMRHVFNMDMASGPLMLKSAALEGGTKMAQDYGRELAAKAP